MALKWIYCWGDICYKCHTDEFERRFVREAATRLWLAACADGPPPRWFYTSHAAHPENRGLTCFFAETCAAPGWRKHELLPDPAFAARLDALPPPDFWKLLPGEVLTCLMDQIAFIQQTYGPLSGNFRIPLIIELPASLFEISKLGAIERFLNAYPGWTWLEASVRIIEGDVPIVRVEPDTEEELRHRAVATVNAQFDAIERLLSKVNATASQLGLATHSMHAREAAGGLPSPKRTNVHGLSA